MELTISQHGLPLLADLGAAFESAFECLLSMITLAILCRIAHYERVSLLPLLCLAAVLTVCELVFFTLPQSPFLLSPFLAAMSRFLSFACLSYIILARLPATSGILSENGKSDRYPPRVSSPTPETWPFPASLARHHTKVDRQTSSVNLAIAPPASTVAKNDLGRILLALAVSQVLALLCAALDIVLEIIISHTATDFDLAKAGSVVPTRLLDFFIARAAVTCAWGVALLIAIHVMPPTAALGPPARQPLPSKEVIKPTIPKRGIHTSKSPFVRFAHSDSASDYLFVPDPFASMPPPLLPPSAAALGLDLDEVGAKAIGVQYRFAAPRSKGRRRLERKKPRNMSRDEALKHQNSAEPFIPRHHLPLDACLHASMGSEMDEESGSNLGSGATLAHLLLQSLNQDVSTSELRSSPMRDDAPASTPHLEQIPLRSHWSCNSTLKSTRVHSRCSSSHRSDVSFATSENQLKRGGSVNMMSMDVPTPCPSSTGAHESEGRVGSITITDTARP
ncbi:hypothetical protein EV401DRAFT_1885851 [Pisolithus croceorrhizus]|nr:hypothetical protein EV401DRAFT_1885851 [Pisolithus croceorrhizus]